MKFIIAWKRSQVNKMKFISYALDFISFLMQNLKETKQIKSIILFGSAARGEAKKDSDIDVFIDVSENEKQIDKEARKLAEKFFDSIKFKNYWKLLGIENEINVIVGKLEKWKLKDSMLGSSIVLYEHYKPKLEKGKNLAILNWSNIKPNSKRVMLNKKLFGYTHYGRKYSGLIEKEKGRKIGSQVIAVPIEKLNIFLKSFHDLGASVKINRIFEYSD